MNWAAIGSGLSRLAVSRTMCCRATPFGIAYDAASYEFPALGYFLKRPQSTEGAIPAAQLSGAAVRQVIAAGDPVLNAGHDEVDQGLREG